MLILQMDTNIIKIEDSLENSTTLQNMNHPRGNINKQSFSYKKDILQKIFLLLSKIFKANRTFRHSYTYAHIKLHFFKP